MMKTSLRLPMLVVFMIVSVAWQVLRVDAMGTMNEDNDKAMWFKCRTSASSWSQLEGTMQGSLMCKWPYNLYSEVIQGSKAEGSAVADHPLCKELSVEDCHGSKAARVKKICPNMCAQKDSDEFAEGSAVADHPLCKELSVEDCHGSKAARVKKICPNMCAQKDLDKTAEGSAVADHPLCKQLSVEDCHGSKAARVKKICPNMCAQKDSDKTECVDQDPNCAISKYNCGKYKAMESTCPKTCGFCQEAEGSAVADHQLCKELSVEDCDGSKAARVKKICPNMCAQKDSGKTAEGSAVADHPLCKELSVEDCHGSKQAWKYPTAWAPGRPGRPGHLNILNRVISPAHQFSMDFSNTGSKAERVKKICPNMCAQKDSDETVVNKGIIPEEEDEYEDYDEYEY